MHGAGVAGELGHITVTSIVHLIVLVVRKAVLETVASATRIVNLTRRYADDMQEMRP
ncbi:MAG: hypothetical protein ACLRSL_05975 [Streptococcus sp.]